MFFTAIRRTCTGVGAAVLLCTLWLLLPLRLGIRRWLNVSAEPISADAIVCISGGTGVANVPLDVGWERIYTALQLFADGYAPFVVFTGGGFFARSQAEAYADAAAWLGLPRHAMLIEPMAANTADHPLEVLKAGGGRLTRRSRLLLVTSALHSRRVLLVFRKQGFTNIRVVTAYRAHRGEIRLPQDDEQSSAIPGYQRDLESSVDIFRRTRTVTSDLITSVREATALGWYWWKGFV